MGKGFGQHRNIAADSEWISDINCSWNKNNLIKTENAVIFMKKIFHEYDRFIVWKTKDIKENIHYCPTILCKTNNRQIIRQ